MNRIERRRRWTEFTQSVTLTASWMIGWAAVLILFGTGWR